jgi:hypothetical protein
MTSSAEDLNKYSWFVQNATRVDAEVSAFFFVYFPRVLFALCWLCDAQLCGFIVCARVIGFFCNIHLLCYVVNLPGTRDSCTHRRCQLERFFFFFLRIFFFFFFFFSGIEPNLKLFIGGFHCVVSSVGCCFFFRRVMCALARPQQRVYRSFLLLGVASLL